MPSRHAGNVAASRDPPIHSRQSSWRHIRRSGHRSGRRVPVGETRASPRAKGGVCLEARRPSSRHGTGGDMRSLAGSSKLRRRRSGTHHAIRSEGFRTSPTLSGGRNMDATMQGNSGFPRLGQPAPAFEAQTTHGTIRLEDFKGRLISINGSAIRGEFCFRIRPISPRSAPPNSSPSPRWHRN